MEKSKETTKKIILDNVQIINKNNFVELYDKIISEYDYNEWSDVKDKFKKANVGKGMVDDVESKYYQTHRIKQIKCYNVGFGDCFLCMDDNKNGPKMLVDCGEHNSFKNLSVLNDVYDELIMAKQKNLMISHLHQDHYNGISQLLVAHKDLKFDNIYLPNYISNGSLELYAAMVFYEKKDNPLSRAARAVLSIPGIFATNLSQRAKIYFACEGKIIYNNLCVFETILPKKWAKKPCLIDNVQIKEFCSRYLKIFNLEPDNDGCITMEVSVSQEYNIKEEIDELLREYDDTELPVISEYELEKLKKTFEKHHNNMSLAFHETKVCDMHNVLFLGDAEKRHIKYACDTYARSQYCFLKIPHHGTKAHFYKYLPFAKYYAITNGTPHKTWEITDLYDAQYGANAAFICSNNANCEIYQKFGLCQSRTNNGAICGIMPPKIFELVKI